uniref:Uncharacterized protein n=1 Tax=Rhizophora mucronata TaxID=61149 RepID=A0A2P2Q134_RHIMU
MWNFPLNPASFSSRGVRASASVRH